MGKEGFISEDGASFVSIKDGDDATDDTNVNDDTNVDDSNFDINKVPEEFRGTFTKLLGELKEKSSSLDGLKDKADLTNAIKELITSNRSNVKDVSEPVVDNDPFKDLKFEDGDYYKKFIEPLISEVRRLNSQIKTLGGEVVNTKKSTWVDKVHSFVKSEGLTKPVIDKMDELARSMGQGVYNDLPRLAKLAKMELGVKDEPASKRDDGNDTKRKNVVNFNNKRKGADSAKPKVKSMADAWDAAEDKLAESD
jgi:hypothetical protein